MEKVSAFATKVFPIVTWLPKYKVEHGVRDLIAGLTVGLTVIPQGLAYANLAELPSELGLYSSFMGVFIYWPDLTNEYIKCLLRNHFSQSTFIFYLM